MVASFFDNEKESGREGKGPSRRILINKYRRNGKNRRLSLGKHNCYRQSPQMDAKSSRWKFEEKLCFHSLKGQVG